MYTGVSAQVYPPETYTNRKEWNKVLDEKTKSFDPENIPGVENSQEIKDGKLLMKAKVILDAPYDDVTKFFYQYQNISYLYKGYTMVVKTPGEKEFFGAGSQRESSIMGLSYKETLVENRLDYQEWVAVSPLVKYQKGTYHFTDLGGGKTQMDITMDVEFVPFIQNMKFIYKFIEQGNLTSMYTFKSLLEEDPTFYKRITWLNELIQKKGWPTPPPIE
ncbi:MAG: hypothetical protein C4K58_08280 [Flavobacteriaceae bacterium]|nr:MAG: hypothetical protein C4K58_08280 [Flavobacteriaceae bacterium]